MDAQQPLDRWTCSVQSLIRAGADVIQLRDKQLADRPLLQRAKRLREITRASPALFIMNDRPDLAQLADADGVHVGQEELTVSDTRHIAGSDRLIGVSTHSVAQARQAVLDGADYIGVGPTFPSATKQFDAFTGLGLLRQVFAELGLPGFAIGGINLDNLAAVLTTGCRRVAVSGAVHNADDPVTAIEEIRRRLLEYCVGEHHEPEERI